MGHHGKKVAWISPSLSSDTIHYSNTLEQNKNKIFDTIYNHI